MNSNKHNTVFVSDQQNLSIHIKRKSDYLNHLIQDQFIQGHTTLYDELNMLTDALSWTLHFEHKHF